MKELSFLFSFLLLLSLHGAGEPVMVAYRKNCAVTPEGALLEAVWKAIPHEGALLSAGGKPPRFPTAVKAVYEREYLCFGLKMEMERVRLEQEITRKIPPGEAFSGPMDTVELVLSSKNGEWKENFFLTPSWLQSSWTQDRINPSGIKWGGHYYSAEIRIPARGEEFPFLEGQKYTVSIRRTYRTISGKPEESAFRGTLLLGGLAWTDDSPRANTKIWRNGEMNTFFKRPNRRWNSNWDLGKGDYLQQGWNLNKAKGVGRFEVFAHEDKKDDYYVVLRNGDFYQVYKGVEKKMSYTFQAKGKGILKVRFLRFSLKDHALKLLGVQSERVIPLNSDEWKTYSGTVEKQSPNESLALDFSTEDSEIMLDEAYMRGIK